MAGETKSVFHITDIPYDIKNWLVIIRNFISNHMRLFMLGIQLYIIVLYREVSAVPHLMDLIVLMQMHDHLQMISFPLVLRATTSTSCNHQIIEDSILLIITHQ